MSDELRVHIRTISPLTPMQRRIAEMVACGEQQRNIAREFDCNVYGVKREMRSIFDACGVRSRPAVIISLIAAGEIDPNEIAPKIPRYYKAW